MQRDILWEANEHGLLSKDVLTTVEDPPCKHGCREAIDASRLTVPWLCALIYQSQLALLAIVQSDTPIKEAADNDSGWSTFHRGFHTLNAPFWPRTWCLTLRCSQHADLVTTPLPMLGFSQQVTRRIQLSVRKAELDQLLRVFVCDNMPASRSQDRCEQVPWYQEELFTLLAVQLLEVRAHEVADSVLQSATSAQALVLQGRQTVVRCQTLHNSRLQLRWV
mmetsp:Transcript_20217/g.36657  ORF Transcript_20217/g.36657 Transcript_20217/m.36657 type:complete len:221 (-) Transcript_20217:378-1040(-)